MKQYGINGKKQVLGNLKNLMKSAGQKYSIRVGIIGEQASQIHKGSGLTNAQLGAVHEFGKEIEVTEKMRGYLHSIGIHLKKDTTHISIPARSFLRAVLLNKQIQEQIYDAAGISGATSDRELNKELILLEMMQGNTQILEDIANIVGARALEFVQTAFYVGGYPDQWPQITEITKKNRKGSPDNPPLNSTGDLMDSVTVEVKKIG